MEICEHPRARYFGEEYIEDYKFTYYYCGECDYLITRSRYIGHAA